jgi:hypothetical protein
MEEDGYSIELGEIEDNFTIQCKEQYFDIDLLGQLSKEELESILTKYEFGPCPSSDYEKIELIRILRTGAKIGPILRKKMNPESSWSGCISISLIITGTAMVTCIITVLAFLLAMYGSIPM